MQVDRVAEEHSLHHRGRAFGLAVLRRRMRQLRGAVLRTRSRLERCFLFYVRSPRWCALVGYCVLPQYYRARDTIESAEDAYLWTNRFFWTQLAGSVFLGKRLHSCSCGSRANLANHLFLWLVWMVIAARFMVYRVARLEFFLESVVPFGTMHTVRAQRDRFHACRYRTRAPCLGGLFALQVILRRWPPPAPKRRDMDTHLRFANEDMARELEEARDEALKKRFEAEAANASKTTFTSPI